MEKKLSKNPNVFTDFHHASLLQSLILLFERRFGGNVYRPIGMEWAEQGYWKVYDHPATQQQFLTLAQGYQPEDGSKPLNNIDKVEDGVYYCQDIDSGYYNKAITLQKFLELPIDIIIASLPQHIDPFIKLAAMHPNNPKLIYQIGNNWNIDGAMLIPNVMISANVPVPQWLHSITYHQEFDTSIFNYREPQRSKNIYSFVNCFDTTPHFQPDVDIFLQLEQQLSAWQFRMFGGQCRDGTADGTVNLANKMAEARFIWHTKFGGDGYGHVLFNSAAVGRPTIVKLEYYRGKLGEKLLRDNETCVAIDGLSVEQILNKLAYFNEETNYAKMCQAVRDNFKAKVDFDQEAVELAKFIDELH